MREFLKSTSAIVGIGLSILLADRLTLKRLVLTSIPNTDMTILISFSDSWQGMPKIFMTISCWFLYWAKVLGIILVCGIVMMKSLT